MHSGCMVDMPHHMCIVNKENRYATEKWWCFSWDFKKVYTWYTSVNHETIHLTLTCWQILTNIHGWQSKFHRIYSLISKLNLFCIPLNMMRYPSLLNQVFLNCDTFNDWYFITMISCHVVCMEGAMETLHCVR